MLGELIFSQATKNFTCPTGQVLKKSGYTIDQISSLQRKTSPISCQDNYIWFCHIWFLIFFTRIKNTSNKIKILHHKKSVFHLCKDFSTYLSILKCVSKLLKIAFEILTMPSCQIWTLNNTFTVPEAHIYELNITRTADKDYEHMNTSRRCRN